MIGFLSGILKYRQGEVIVIDVNGVGYEVVASGAVLSRYSDGCGAFEKKIDVVVYTDVKENSISLYGFNSILERSAFLLLKKVKGIGSRIALTIISSIEPDELLISIGREDIAVLQRVPGVGRKTAERIIIELRESVSKLATDEKISRTQQIDVLKTDNSKLHKFVAIGQIGEDAILALCKLGFSEDLAKGAITKALATAANNADITDSGQLLKLAFTYL